MLTLKKWTHPKKLLCDVIDYNIINTKHQLLLKYDFYDQNKSLTEPFDETPEDYTEADLRYDTWGMGYCYYLNKHCKVILYYDIIKNEPLVVGDKDLEDNVFTARIHFSF